MNCDNCLTAQEMDCITPACQTTAGCLIPALTKPSLRLLEIRSTINRLRNLIDPGTICRMYDVDIDDLQLLALVEDELQSNEDSDGQRDQTTD